MRIELQNKKTKEVITFDNISDLNNGEKLFYKFSINASSLEDGEYGLSLFDGDNLIATDTLCVGDFDVNGLQYKKGESIYIENILNTKIEDKVVSVNDIKTTVLPTEGYDAMATVGVNAQPVYDKGYFDGAKSATQNTDVLNITENGIYPTMYSTLDDIPESYITGYNEDGTPFCNYAHLTNQAYEFAPTRNNRRIEMWWKPDFNYIFFNDFAPICATYACNFGFYIDNNDKYLYAKMNGQGIPFEEPLKDKWYHLILSKDDGFIVDNTKVGDFKDFEVGQNAEEVYLNSALAWANNAQWYANGYYGMVKINNTIYLPSENGYINANYNTPQDEFRKGEYEFTDPIPPFSGDLVRTINVDVTPKIKLSKYGLKFAYSNISELPEWADLEGTTDCSYLFSNCGLRAAPYFDTSNVVFMNNMFYYCSYLETVPEYDTSNVVNMTNMFGSSTIKRIPQFDTSKVEYMGSMFQGCFSLEYIPLLSAYSLRDIGSLFGYSTLSNLTYFGGFKNLKIDWTSYGSLRMVPNLTHQSIVSIISNLYDFRGNGDSTTRTIEFSNNSRSLITDDDIAMATNMGWIITFG